MNADQDTIRTKTGVITESQKTQREDKKAEDRMFFRPRFVSVFCFLSVPAVANPASVLSPNRVFNLR